MSRPPYSRSHGFTLIEVMVVMLMVTIILAVAIPKFDGAFLQDPTKRVTRHMINSVRALRRLAVQQQTPQMLVIDLDKQRFWVANAGMDEETVKAATEKAFELPDAVEFVQIQFSNQDPIATGEATIHFYPAGYSDHVVVHFLDQDEDRYSYVVEPLLPKVKFLEEWIDL